MSFALVFWGVWAVLVVGSVAAALVRAVREPRPRRLVPMSGVPLSDQEVAIRLLTDRFVADEIELDEFERRVARALRR